MTSIASSESRPVPASSSLAGWDHLPQEYAIPGIAPSLEEARAYCQRLATTHYENFSVATWFLPKRLRQHFQSSRERVDFGHQENRQRDSRSLSGNWTAANGADRKLLQRMPDRKTERTAKFVGLEEFREGNLVIR